MSMFLDSVPVFFIMLSGRWSSDAFLKYTRKQVIEFSKGLASRMIKNDLFHTLPDMRSTEFNPRTQNPNSFASQLSIPMVDASGMRAAMRPSFCVALLKQMFNGGAQVLGLGKNHWVEIKILRVLLSNPGLLAGTQKKDEMQTILGDKISFKMALI
eukprot:14825322-Ditylum_brightwellii.AAC.1